MTEVDINDIGLIGGVRDQPSYMLPPEAWSLAENVRAVEQGMEKLTGWEATFGPPLFPVSFILPVTVRGLTYWLYTSLTSAAVWNGTAHFNITRNVGGGGYSTVAHRNWQGALFGGLPILNNGVDIPQYWPNQTTSTRLANLPNWPGPLRAAVIRPFTNFLVALHLTDGSTVLPHTIQWSHPAPAGSVPSSWDYANPAVDARRKDFEDVESGVIQDALRLSSALYVYKETAIHRMRYIGGRLVFGFDSFLETTGLLAPRCVCAVQSSQGSVHVFASNDDILIHNGASVRSALDTKMRRALFSSLDTTFYVNSFIFDNPMRREVWFCYPTGGAPFGLPNRAVILNYAREPWRVTEADGMNAVLGSALGDIGGQGGADLAWDATTNVWDDASGSWSQSARRKVVLAMGGVFMLHDSGTNRDGAPFIARLRRDGLSVIGRKRNGEWIVDHQVEKMVDRLWPKVRGGSVMVRVGVQATVDGPTQWGVERTFDPTTEVFVDVDPPQSGRSISVEFFGDTSWSLDGYKINVSTLGEF